jgi:hypothetical protein
MQIERTENELIIRETPGCLWIFGLFFAIVGGVFVYGSLGGLADYERQTLWMLALAFVMGSVGVATGVWIIYSAPITKIVVNRIDYEVRMTRYGLFGKQKTFYDFDDIEQFCLIEEVDDESNPIWSLGMRLNSGETIKISSLPSHDERFKREFVFQTNEFMFKQISVTENVFELTDEAFDKNDEREELTAK